MTKLSLTALLASAAATALLCGQAAAEEDFALLVAAGALDEITVTATKNPIEAFSYPGSVTVITRDEIDDLAASSVGDLFDNLAGVRFDGGPRRTGETPSIRGQEGEGVLILFDGVRQSFLSGHDGRFFIEPDMLKAAEVVRGPGSALYGSGAVGGVLAFETLDASDVLADGETAAFRLRTGYQDVNSEWTAGGAMFAQSADGKLDVVANLSYRDAGDIALGDDSDLPADDSVLSGLLKGSAELTDALTGEVAWLSYYGEAREPNNGQGGNTGDLVDKDIQSNLFRAGVTFNPESNDWIDAGLIGYFNESEVEEDEIDSTRVIARTVETYGFVFDNRTRFALGDNGRLTFTYGGEYYEDEQTGTDNTTADGSRGGVPDATATTWGAFIQAEINVDTAIGAFILIPAIRRDSFENEADGFTIQTDDEATSPKVGLSWKPADWLLVYGNYAEAFRAPSFNEIFADNIHFQIPLGPFVTAPNFFIPNPDLEPEESETWEVGGGVDFQGVFSDSDRFIAKGSYYQSDVKNLIDLEVDFAFSPACFSAFVPGPCTSGTSQNVNTANAELSGFEFEFEYDSEYFYLSGNHSGIDGTDEDTGEFVGVLSPNRTNVDAGVRIPSIDARLGARAEFAGKFREVNNPAEIRDEYTAVDLYVVWAPDQGALDGLRVDLGVDNVGDAEIERVFAGVFDPGRNFKVSARWTSTF